MSDNPDRKNILVSDDGSSDNTAGAADDMKGRK